MASLLRQVITHDIYLIEYLRCSALEGIRLALASVGIRVHDDIDALLLQRNLNVGVGHDRVAVEMYHPGLGAVYMQMLGSERLDFGALVERLIEHVNAYLGRFEQVEWLHDDYIHQSVAHGCLWRNVAIVAVLRRIGTRDQESLISSGPVLITNLVSLRLVLQSFLQNLLDISDGATLACFGKLVTDTSVETHSASTEEGIAIDDTIVERSYLAQIDNLERLPDINRYHQVARKTIARATGDNAQSRMGMNDGATYLIDGPIATNSHADINPISDSLSCQLLGMTRILGNANLTIKLAAVYIFVD